MATISVAMTTYDGECFLGEQLCSIAAQERLPEELVVADDQSSDQTCKLVTDSERTAHPAKVAIPERTMADPDAPLFFHDAWLIDETGQRAGPANIFSLPESNPPLSVYSFFSPDGFTMVCHRSLLVLSDLWDRSTDSNDRRDCAPHDQWLFFLATVLGTVRFSQERLAGYRQHVSNAVGQPVPAGLPSRLRRAQQYQLSNPKTRFRNLAAVARDRADILAACRDWLSGTGQERTALGRARYLEVASRLESRAELYGDRSTSARAQRLQQLRRSGVYRGASAWDFIRVALMKDAMLAWRCGHCWCEEGQGHAA
jgi:glycosyltransferase involved in cell wall biosynthesis